MEYRPTLKTDRVNRKYDHKPEVVIDFLIICTRTRTAIDVHSWLMFHCIGNCQKHGFGIWNRISIYNATYVISTSGFWSAILNITWAMWEHNNGLCSIVLLTTQYVFSSSKFEITFLSIMERKLFPLLVLVRHFSFRTDPLGKQSTQLIIGLLCWNPQKHYKL